MNGGEDLEKRCPERFRTTRHPSRVPSNDRIHLGFGWPNLPNGIVLFAGAVALAVLFALLIRPATNPVQKRISNADDYISIIVTGLPILTGIIAFAHIGGRYETLLAIHLLSIEALFVWFPFGKLMHTAMSFPSRYQAGTSFGRKGVKA